MSILGWIILGGIAGWIASILTSAREGCLVNVALGIVGALLGGFIFSLLGGVGVSGLNIWSLFVAVVGAVILILVMQEIRKRE